MSERHFNPDSAEEDNHSESQNADEQEVPDLRGSSSEEEDEQENDEEQQLPKKKWAAAEQREFIEVNRWDRTDNSDEDIAVFICKELDGLNRNAGIQHLPDAHKDSKELGNVQFQHSWRSNKDFISSTIVNCPLFKLCGCRSQAKMVQMPTLTTLSISNSHYRIAYSIGSHFSKSPRKTRPNIFPIGK